MMHVALRMIGVITLPWMLYMTWIWSAYKTPQSVKSYLSKKIPVPWAWKTVYYGYLLIVGLYMAVGVGYLLLTNP